MRPTHWLLFAGLLLAAPPARAEDAHADMARALEASAEVEPPEAALPTVSPIAQARETPALPVAAATRAAAKANAAANGRAMAAALARAARAATEAASAASDRAAKVRVHGREHPGRGVDR